jgi:hypothetical protein
MSGKGGVRYGPQDYDVAARRWDGANIEMTEVYVYPNGWGVEVVTNLRGGAVDASSSVRLLAVDPDWVLTSNIGEVPTGDAVPDEPDRGNSDIWFTERGESPDWLTPEGLRDLCALVGRLPARVVDLGECQWFALCDRAATHMEAHPAIPGGVPACDRCASIGK